MALDGILICPVLIYPSNITVVVTKEPGMKLFLQKNERGNTCFILLEHNKIPVI